MQELDKPRVNKPKPKRPTFENLATSEEVNLLFATLRSEIAQLRSELEQLKQQPKSSFTMSPKQALRWDAIRAAKEKLKAGESLKSVTSFLDAEAQFQPLFNGNKPQAIQGLLKIAQIQVGGLSGERQGRDRGQEAQS
jgi:hypothetical protein